MKHITNTRKNHPFSLSPSGAQHSKKENRECISPDQRRLYTALTRSIIQTPRGGEREEELVRLYRKNFKPRGEETAFEIYRKRENMSVLAKHATVNNDEDIRERAANGAVSTSGKGAGFARFFYRFFARGAAR